MQVTSPHCEYLAGLIFTDETRPRLSWKLKSSRRGQVQSAWRVLVASSLRGLTLDEGDLWDSGKVASAQSSQIAYAGAPLKSAQECWWKVMVWDGQDQPTAWSQPSRWTMGLLAPGDWKGQWIGWGGEQPVFITYDGCRWLWTPPQPQDHQKPPTHRYFRQRFTLPKGRHVHRAWLLLTVRDQFKLYVNGLKAAQSNWQGDSWQQPQQICLTLLLDEGRENTLAVWAEQETPQEGGILGKLRVEFEDGEVAEWPLDTGGKISAQCQAGWNQPDFDDSAWPQAVATSPADQHPLPTVPVHRLAPVVLPWLRKSFELPATPVRRATLFATALGLYEIHLNGQKVGQDTLRPGWTDFSKRLYYQGYDVTSQLSAGTNALAAELAPGWYAGNLAWKPYKYYGERPALRAQLHVEFEDGSCATLATDTTWKAAPSDLQEADLLMGCHTDLRTIPQDGWTGVDFDHSAWAPAALIPGPKPPRLELHPGPTVRPIQTLPPKAITEPAPGVYIFDMAQNMVGWARLKVQGQASGRITLRHGEMLNADGTLYTDNLRRARATDVFVLDGRNSETTLEPRFTFHGFRYVEVRGLNQPPTLADLEGIVVHSDTPPVIDFETSSPLVNQLISNVRWGQRCNYLEVPTDCPQRDERLGWTGDAQVFIRTATYLSDVSAFFKKWLVDLEDAQRDNGAFTDIAPQLEPLGHGVAAWADAGIVCPYVMWQTYGDLRLLARHWDAMTAYLNYMETTSVDLVRPDMGYGDWLNINADMSRPAIGTAYFAWDCTLMTQMAHALGKQDEAAAYEDLGRRVRQAFCETFVHADGKIDKDTQTCYLLALTMDLLPTQDARDKAMKHLVDNIEANDGLLSCGFVGVSLLNPALTQGGRNDLAYRLLLEERFPSWLFEVRNGATTIWERWNSWTHKDGFGDIRMNSFNHYCFGSVGEWLFGTVAGIWPAEPGYRTVRIAPRPDRQLGRVRLGYDSPQGLIRSQWEWDEETWRLEVEIPANTRAQIILPAASAEMVTESGKALDQADGLELIGTNEEGSVCCQAGSGTYRFAVKLTACPQPRC